MKAKALEIGFKAWTIGIGALAIFGIAFSIYKLAVGEYCGTASFEF